MTVNEAGEHKTRGRSVSASLSLRESRYCLVGLCVPRVRTVGRVGEVRLGATASFRS
jgi:hypothetical protein